MWRAPAGFCWLAASIVFRARGDLVATNRHASLTLTGARRPVGRTAYGVVLALLVTVTVGALIWGPSAWLLLYLGAPRWLASWGILTVLGGLAVAEFVPATTHVSRRGAGRTHRAVETIRARGWDGETWVAGTLSSWPWRKAEGMRRG